MSKKQKYFLSAALLVVITFPYLLGWMVSGENVFNGFLLNPVDGNSYLAKMYQGWRGEWQFTLPYTAETGEGAYLFLFYLFLGHLARLLGMPLFVVFHIARVFSALFLSQILILLFHKIFEKKPDLAVITSWLVVFGSGMGWLVALFGLIPSDFWVSETYPFLSSYANPHFPLGLAILICILILAMQERRAWQTPLFVTAGLLEAVILPFGVVVIALILASWALWTWVEERSTAALSKLSSLVATLLFGGPLLVYQVWVSQTDPVLSGWNAQNITPSPPVWDFVLSLSPAFLLACVGAIYLWKMKQHPARRWLLAWFVLGGILVYLPFALQRRFMLGYYIPTVALAGFGLDAVKQNLLRRRMIGWLFGLSLVTNLFLLLGGILSVVGHAAPLFLTHDEHQALLWIRRETASDALVLASPEIGNYIPAHTGRRVIYGHPFETVNAVEQENKVRAFYGGSWSELEMGDFLAQRKVDYVFWGARERALNENPSAFDLERLNLTLVHQEGDLRLYAVGSDK